MALHGQLLERHGAAGLLTSGDWNVNSPVGTQPASYLLRGMGLLQSQAEVVMQVLAAERVRVA